MYYFHDSNNNLIASDFRLHPSLGSRQNMNMNSSSTSNNNNSSSNKAGNRISQQRAYSMGEFSQFSKVQYMSIHFLYSFCALIKLGHISWCAKPAPACKSSCKWHLKIFCTSGSTNHWQKIHAHSYTFLAFGKKMILIWYYFLVRSFCVLNYRGVLLRLPISILFQRPNIWIISFIFEILVTNLYTAWVSFFLFFV